MTSSRASRPATSPTRPGVRNIAAAVGQTALDLYDAMRARRAQALNQTYPPVRGSITIERSPEAVYELYRKFSQLPLFMDYLHTVREADPRWSHWVARLPTGTIAWDVKITEDIPGQVIAWRSTKESKVQMRGRVTFARTAHGATEVHVEMQLGYSGSKPNPGLATFFTEAQITGDLQRLKDTLESEDRPEPVPLPVQPMLPQVKEVWRFERPQVRIVAS